MIFGGFFLRRGYSRWNEILMDARFSLLSIPFKSSGAPFDFASKFITRRFKVGNRWPLLFRALDRPSSFGQLLEQALCVEEQIKRASCLGIAQSTSDPIMSLQNR